MNQTERRIKVEPEECDINLSCVKQSQQVNTIGIATQTKDVICLCPAGVTVSIPCAQLCGSFALN